MAATEVFMVAGEESANQYAQKIISSFTESEVKFSGIGYPSLKSQKFNLIFDAQKLSVMGAFEVLVKYRLIEEAFKKSIDHIKKNRPKVVVLIDFGGFNLKLAKRIKEEGLDIKILYFISPKFWAWGEKRVLKMKNYVDQVCVIHPFEVDFYKKWGVEAKFVGHPLLDELKPHYFDKDWIEKERRLEGIDPEKKVLGVLLGSRDSEINRHKEPFLKAACMLKKKYDLEVALIIPPSRAKNDFLKFLDEVNLNAKVLKSKEPMEKMALCDLFLVASGTATLQVGLLEKPMAIGYKMNPLTMFLAKTFVKGVKYAGLVNIIKDKEVIKEFLQADLTAENLKNYLSLFLDSEKNYKNKQKELASLKSDLGSVKTYEALKNEIKSLI